MAIEPLVGALPAGWEYTTLGEACAHGGGDVQTGPFGSQLHAADYVPSGIPSIMPQNIGDNRVIPDGIARIRVQDAERLGRYRVRSGDIVYSRRGDVERRALIRQAEDGWLCGTGCLRVRFGVGEVNPTYAAYYLGDSRVREWVVRHAHGATMPNLNTDILSALPFVAPPLPDQRAIAHILGTLDDKIELNRRMNETLEAIARALFDSWFVRFDPVRRNAARKGRGQLLRGQPSPRPGGHPSPIGRGDTRDGVTAVKALLPPLPLGEGRGEGVVDGCAFDHLFPDSFEDSELGEIPKGWRVAALDEVATFLNGLALQKYPPSGRGDLPVIKIAELRQGHRGGCDWADSAVGAEYVVDDGDVLFSWSGSLLVEIWCGGKGALNQHLFKVTSADFPKWIYFMWTRHHLPDFQAIASGKATTMGHIQRYHLNAAKVVVPPARLLDAMDGVFAPLMARYVASNVESRTLAALRDTLLPKLISGELRLKDPEWFIEEAT